ncbi:hypothetical protein [Haloarchaeobius sp. FL176]|uniref:hypothetical protein n=1 Tax=Haloarchaeobius sp. FL176 TaxID=2967129 RepID=UPI0021493C1C|nr:hypothetical protein [Haloarchaeobius sp. FL176]
MSENADSTETSRIARRALLSSIAAGSVMLAGCSSDSSSTATSTSESRNSSQTEPNTQLTTPEESSVFADIRVGTTHIEVELAEGSSIDRVNLIKPDGELQSRSGVSTGVRQVSLRFSDDWEYTRGGYSPGTYRLVAIAGGESVEEAEIDLRPDVSIADVRWAKYDSVPWDNPGEPPSHLAQIVLENTGTGPGLVETLETVDTPYDLGVVRDGIDVGRHVMVPQGGTASLTSRRIFRKGSSGGIRLDCEEYETVTFTITARLQMSDSAPTYSQAVRYGTDNNGTCDLSLVPREEGTTEEGEGE